MDSTPQSPPTILPTPSAYTPAQLSAYSSLISLPPQYHHSASPTPDLALLTALHTHHITTIPYENLSLHYVAARGPPSLDPAALWEKMVGCNRGRGGYCVEGTIFFKNVLRGFGFSVYTAGARIRLREGGVPGGDYIGWVHTVNIVTLPSSTRYMTDVSFGGDGPTLPLPLTPSTPHTNLGTQQIRLVHDYIPHQVLRSGPPAHDPNRMWIYQYRNGAEKEWNAFYAFHSEVEFLDADLGIVNAFAAGDSFQTVTVLAVKFLRGEGGVVGKVMLADGVVKINEGGRTRVLRVCASEGERVAALREVFGVGLTGGEEGGIRGWRTELKG